MTGYELGDRDKADWNASPQISPASDGSATACKSGILIRMDTPGTGFGHDAGRIWADVLSLYLLMQLRAVHEMEPIFSFPPNGSKRVSQRFRVVRMFRPRKRRCPTASSKIAM